MIGVSASFDRRAGPEKYTKEPNDLACGLSCGGQDDSFFKENHHLSLAQYLQGPQKASKCSTALNFTKPAIFMFSAVHESQATKIYQYHDLHDYHRHAYSYYFNHQKLPTTLLAAPFLHQAFHPSSITGSGGSSSYLRLWTRLPWKDSPSRSHQETCLAAAQVPTAVAKHQHTSGKSRASHKSDTVF